MGSTSQIPQSGAALRGDVRGLHQRSETKGQNWSQTVWTFTLDRYDSAGNRLPPIPVEMRGDMNGVINEGDQVEIYSKWTRGQTLKLKQLRNLTTGGMVVVSGPNTSAAITCMVLFVLFGVIMVVGFIVLSLVLSKQ